MSLEMQHSKGMYSLVCHVSVTDVFMLLDLYGL